MAVNKEKYYHDVAKRLAASTRLYKIDSIVHVEAEDDIRFWDRVLSHYRKGRYMFLPATKNEFGNMTSGCTQCLKYRDYLSQRFFICIDSDLRYLLGEDLKASDGILQTYTYSWENHLMFPSILQQKFNEKTGKGKEFDFEAFIKAYSSIIYKPMLLMLHQEYTGREEFAREHFRKCISVVYRTGDERHNGRRLLRHIRERLELSTEGLYDNFNFGKISRYYEKLGLREDNAYFYVRGHCIYNMIASIGRHFCDGLKTDFERDILDECLIFDAYQETKKIRNDIKTLNTIRHHID